jgi:hypothetical protein
MNPLRQTATIAAMLASGTDLPDLFGGGYSPPRKPQSEDEKQAALDAAEAKRNRRAERNRKNAAKS